MAMLQLFRAALAYRQQDGALSLRPASACRDMHWLLLIKQPQWMWEGCCWKRRATEWHAAHLQHCCHKQF